MLLIAWAYRQLFACCFRIKNILFRPDDPHPEIVHASLLPWLWIGGVTGENTVDYTAEINSTIVYGMVVTTDWLDAVTNATPETWKYLDPKTLEEKDFPPSGFVIEDDTVSAEPEDESDSTNANADHTE